MIVDITRYFQDNRFKVSAIIHDGIILEKNPLFTENTLRECQEFIDKKWNGMEIKLVVKPFLTGIFQDIPTDWTGEDDDDLGAYPTMCNKLLTHTTENKIRKIYMKIFMHHRKLIHYTIRECIWE